MKEIESKITGSEYALVELEAKMQPLGYVIGGHWDYEHGSFDYKMTDEGSYVYLRIPFNAIEGQLDRDDCIVQLGKPFVLHHKYRKDGDQTDVDVNNLNAAISQFQTPLEKDAEVSEDFVELGKQHIRQLESFLLA